MRLVILVSVYLVHVFACKGSYSKYLRLAAAEFILGKLFLLSIGKMRLGLEMSEKPGAMENEVYMHRCGSIGDFYKASYWLHDAETFPQHSNASLAREYIPSKIGDMENWNAVSIESSFRLVLCYQVGVPRYNVQTNHIGAWIM